MYKFLNDVIFKVFAVNWPSVKLSSLKFIGKSLACMSIGEQDRPLLLNGYSYMTTFDICKEMMITLIAC